jgi:hypothetical protein
LEVSNCLSVNVVKVMSPPLWTEWFRVHGILE